MDSERPKKKQRGAKKAPAVLLSFSARPAARRASEQAVHEAANALSEAVTALGRSLGEAVSIADATDDVVNRGLRAAAASIEEITTKISSTPKPSAVTKNILEAAAQTFAERGFDGVTVDEIASDAGYTKGAVYSRFTSKTDLFLAVVEKYLTPCDPADTQVGPTPDEHLRLRLVLEAIMFGLRHEDEREQIADVISAVLDGVAREVDPDAPPGTVSSRTVLAASASTFLSALQDLGITEVQEITLAELLPSAKEPGQD